MIATDCHSRCGLALSGARVAQADSHWVPLSAAERHGVALIASGCHGVTVLVMMRDDACAAQVLCRERRAAAQEAASERLGLRRVDGACSCLKWIFLIREVKGPADAVRDVCVKWIFLQGRSGLTRYVTGVLWLLTSMFGCATTFPATNPTSQSPCRCPPRPSPATARAAGESMHCSRRRRGARTAAARRSARRSRPVRRQRPRNPRRYARRRATRAAASGEGTRDRERHRLLARTRTMGYVTVTCAT